MTHLNTIFRVVIATIAIAACALHAAARVIVLHPRDTVAVSDTTGFTKVFLAGTIDMGNSIDWQSALADRFADFNGNFVLFNPRQGHWDPTIKGAMDYQVNWELDHLESADFIVMNILGSSKSPITLLEMGLFARSGKLAVVCEPSFYRYDNVRITCAKYHVPLYSSCEQMIASHPFFTTQKDQSTQN